MPRLTIELDCPLHDSFRVRQVAGLFDVPLARRAVERFEVEVPDLDEPWQIGLVVGPSGSGKTALARQWFGPRLRERFGGFQLAPGVAPALRGAQRRRAVPLRFGPRLGGGRERLRIGDCGSRMEYRRAN
jgi:hypothetical protein